MSKLSLKVLLGVFALMFSASVGLAYVPDDELDYRYNLSESDYINCKKSIVGIFKRVKPECNELMICSYSLGGMWNEVGRLSNRKPLSRDYKAEWHTWGFADGFKKAAKKMGHTPESCLKMVTHYISGVEPKKTKKVSVRTAERSFSWDTLNRPGEPHPSSIMTSKNSKTCWLALAWRWSGKKNQPKYHPNGTVGSKINRWSTKDSINKTFSKNIELAKAKDLSADDCFDIIKSDFDKYFPDKFKIVDSNGLLKNTFIRLNKIDRQKVQTSLSDLGFYKSSIDGLYGKGTAAALKAYNKEYLGSADLSKSSNANALLTDILKPQLISEIEEVSTAVTANRFANSTDDTICRFTTLNEQWKTSEHFQPELYEPYVAEAKRRGLDCEVDEKQKAPEPEPSPKLDLAQVQASYDAKDYTKAFADAQVLAVQGDPEAQLLLGKMFADGRGTLQVSTVAHMWFNIASMGGIDEAYEQRKAMTAQMTPSAVEEAQKMAMKCIQSNYADCGLAVTPTAVAQPKPVEKTYITSGSQVEAWFKDETQLKRKQLHYALKKLGVYTSSVDGLWGGNTSRAFTRYINKYKSDAETVDEVFTSILSKVKVPSAFAEPKRVTTTKSTNRSNNAGLTAIISNPSMSGAQALAVCEPQAKLAGNSASNSYKSDSYGSSINCLGFGNSFNCNSYDNSGGVWGGIADGIAKGLARREARDAVMKSCLAQYGWKK